MHNFIDFSLRNLALVLVKPAGACKFYKTYIISSYQGEVRKFSNTCRVTISYFSSREATKFMSSARKFDLAINLASPWNLISLVGFISLSYYKITKIHFLLFWFGSVWVRIYFTTALGTKEIMWECRIHTLKSIKDFTKEKDCFPMILYFKEASLKALLKNVIGCSCPSLFFYGNTATMEAPNM